MIIIRNKSESLKGRINLRFHGNKLAYKDGRRTYREKALKLKPNFCERCQSNKFLNVHHIDENRFHNEISNLQIVCRSCHNKIHNIVANFHIHNNQKEVN